MQLVLVQKERREENVSVKAGPMGRREGGEQKCRAVTLGRVNFLCQWKGNVWLLLKPWNTGLSCIPTARPPTAGDFMATLELGPSLYKAWTVPCLHIKAPAMMV